MKKTKVVIGSREPLVKNLLLVDGISRAGKFLLSNLLGGINDIEPAQNHDMLETLPILEKLGFIDKKLTQTILRNEIDLRAYEMLIGRSFNQRISDKSSIFNRPNYKEYLRRCREKDTGLLVKQYSEKKLYSQFIVHELMPAIKIYFDVFPNTKVISLKRSPVDLVWSWFGRGIVRRFVEDPTFTSFPFERNGQPTYWFISASDRDYHLLGEMDKTISGIVNLFKMYDSAYRRLSRKNRKKILFVRYENILFRPHTVVEEIGRFLGKKIMPEMRSIFKKEGLPNEAYLLSRGEKIQKIKKLASKKYFKKLNVLESRYWSRLS